MASYLHRFPHGQYSIETSRIVREDKFNKLANFPIVRFFAALVLIVRDDAFLRPKKPDSNKPMFYHRGLWRVHNCGQRKDGTFYTSGNASIIIIEEGKEVFDSSKSDLPYSEIKEKWDDMNRRLRGERGSKDLPRKG
jgi:hypothetical protein